MDTSSLVEPGLELLAGLRADRVIIKGAAWLRAPESSWRLVLVPDRTYDKSQEFYERVRIVANRTRNPTLLWNVEVVEPSDPLGRELYKFTPPFERDYQVWTNLVLGQFYFEEAIVYRV